MLRVPKPPGSRQLISPPIAVFEKAPGKVLHGAVRLHGLASSPTPETQVRVACASAVVGAKANQPTHAKPSIAIIFFMELSLVSPVLCSTPAYPPQQSYLTPLQVSKGSR